METFHLIFDYRQIYTKFIGNKRKRAAQKEIGILKAIWRFGWVMSIYLLLFWILRYAQDDVVPGIEAWWWIGSTVSPDKCDHEEHMDFMAYYAPFL